MAYKYKQPHVIEFLEAARKFTFKHGVTSILIVTNEETLEDLDNFGDVCTAPGGMIAEMDNIIGEMVSKLEAYYEENNCKKDLKRLQKFRVKHFKPYANRIPL